jgi:hypothetical protein
LVVLTALLVLGACGMVGREMDGGSPAVVGSWDWLGTPYYVFNEDGSGSMSGIPIRWGARNGALGVCSTPIVCRERCSAPTMWDYSVSGQTMTLTSQLTERLSFEYTRR